MPKVEGQDDVPDGPRVQQWPRWQGGLRAAQPEKAQRRSNAAFRDAGVPVVIVVQLHEKEAETVRIGRLVARGVG